VEYSGNVWFWENTYSTGKADQGNIGYGMSKGEGMIWANLPFVSPDHAHETLDGWGDPDATADYARRAVREIASRYGGDPGAVFLTGFSRGGTACGYIGLRNPEIADVWLAFHAVGGSDGNGLFGADVAGATERAALLKGRSSFVTDGGLRWQDILQKLGQPVRFVNSQIGAHVDTMLLDDRPSTLQCRAWMAEVLKNRPGVHDISGIVRDRKGRPIAGVRVESGFTHFAITDKSGAYTIRSLIDGNRRVTATKTGYSFKPVEVAVNGKHIEAPEIRPSTIFP